MIGVVTPGLKPNRFVRDQAVGVQAGEDLAGGLGGFPQRVQVFDADQPPALVPAGFNVAGKRGDQGAEMQWPGRGRGEAASVARGGHQGAVCRLPVVLAAGSVRIGSDTGLAFADFRQRLAINA